MTASACCSAQAQLPVHMIFFAMRLDQLLALGASCWLKGPGSRAASSNPYRRAVTVKTVCFYVTMGSPRRAKECKALEHPGQDAVM